jgi:uncharacterized protein
MRILAIADRPPTKSISELLAADDTDVIVTLGDLEQHQVGGLETVTTIPKLGVYGNHCSGLYMPALGIENMHLRVLTVGGVIFGGFEGCVRYKQSSAKMYTQEECSALLATFPRVDVMLVHCPPFGVNDDPDEIAHTGFIGLRDWVLREKPALLLHGHTYPEAGKEVTRLGETRIEYVFGEKVVEFSE